MVTEAPKDAQEGSKGRGHAEGSPHLLDQCLATALIAVDQSHHIIAFSPEAENLTGRPAAQTLGRTIDVLPVPLQDILRRTVTSGDPILEQPILLTLPKGQEATLRVSSTPMLSATNPSSGAIAVIHNLTPARDLDHHLQHMDRLASIGTLSASLAHEIKNALVAVKTFVELLIKKHQDAELTDIVGREVTRINSIVSQMLRFARPTTPSLALVNLHQILQQCLDLVRHNIAGRKIRISSNLNASPDITRGDGYQLEQAFLNLLFNALEAMGADGELTVNTELLQAADAPQQQGPVVCVTIRDNGTGMPQETLDRLFEPFFTTKPNGTGLGLPITRRIIQEHQGHITLESTPAKGTCFTIYLPSAARQP